VTGNAPSGSMSLSRVHSPGGCPESHSQGVLDMLAPLIVDLLMTCTVFMLAGWAYDAIGRRFAAQRPFVGSAVPGAFRQMRHAMSSVHRHATGEFWASDRDEVMSEWRA
jgi:hypothetical protein